MITLLFLYGSTLAEPTKQPLADKGFLDLSQWDFEKNGHIELNGQWKFIWNRLIKPHDINSIPFELIDVPLSWNYHQSNGSYLPLSGFATYHLTIKLPKISDLVVRHFFINTVSRVFIDGKKVIDGEFGHHPSEIVFNHSDLRPHLIKPNNSGVHTLVIHAGNHEYFLAGLAFPIYLGKMGQLESFIKRKTVILAVLFGLFMIMGIYHVSLFALRPEAKSPLFFAGICFMIVGILITVNGPLFVFLIPNFDSGWAIRWFNFSWFVLVPAFVVYTDALFPKERFPKIQKLIIVIGSICSLLTLVTPMPFYLGISTFYRPFTLFVGFYLIFNLVRATLYKRQEARIFLTLLNSWVV